MIEPMSPGLRRAVLVVALSSPRFVHQVEVDGTAMASSADLLQLTSYEIASRLSYTFWQTMPDSQLLAAAEARLRHHDRAPCQRRLDLALQVIRAIGGEQQRQRVGVDRLVRPAQHLAQEAPDGPLPLYEFEPDAETLLDSLLPRYVETRVFAAMLEAAASESASRARRVRLTRPARTASGVTSLFAPGPSTASGVKSIANIAYGDDLKAQGSNR